ncbi:MAG: hypothetical protein OXH38_06195 [Chloroflexi bacterium]|nr:hypothetical protein [Chloroflexota bacterium]
MLDATEHSIVWRLRDAARYLGSIIPNVTSAPAPRDREGRHRHWREAMTPQRMNRLSIAHTAIEDGLKHLIKSNGGSYPRTHELGPLLDELRTSDSGEAESLDNAFNAATEFYGTDTRHPDHRHLASLSDYLEKSATRELFELMRYVELESWIDDPALTMVHIEFHYEILCALDEAIKPRYGTTADRVEELARLAFLDGSRFDTSASQGEASKAAYDRWVEEQDSFVDAIRRLTASRDEIEDEHANSAAVGVCYKLTGSDDLALRTIAFALIQCGIVDRPAKRGEIATCVRRPEAAMNDVVSTPAGDDLGYIRPLPTGFWLATDDLHDTDPAWCRTESDARLYLAQLFLIEVPIVTPRGCSIYRVRSPRALGTPEARAGWSVTSIDFAGSATDGIRLKLWESRHDLRVGDQIEIREKPGSPHHWRGRVTDVAGQNVLIGETESLPSRRRGRRGKKAT